ncbi:MAG: ArsA family ATPase [Lautropia sp.]|nr:ArsA family ATPase [Lautropia sp.]
MDPLLQALQAVPLIFVGGKGGVGKTTHAASLACRLAALGRKVLVVSTDPAHSLGDVLAVPLSDTPRELAPGLSALELNPQTMVDQHFAAVEKTIAAYARPEMLPRLRQHLEAAKSSPGAEEAAMLEAICQLVVGQQAQGFEHLVFDTAPTGHTLRLLELPQLMSAWTEGLLAQQGRQQKLREAALPFWQKSGSRHPIMDELKQQRWQQALEVLERRQHLFATAGKLLGDAAHTRIVLVMTPEMLPLAETRRAVAQLRHFGLPCRDLIVNQVMPTQAGDNDFWKQRHARQQEILAQLRHDLADLAHYEYALQSADIRGVEALRHFGAQGLMS